MDSTNRYPTNALGAGLGSAACIGAGYSGSPLEAQASAPRTIASAAGRIDSLNERLGTVIEHLGMISAQIGALSPVSVLNNAYNGQNGQPVPSGAVHRLNDAADAAHARLLEIENFINGIERALG